MRAEGQTGLSVSASPLHTQRWDSALQSKSRDKAQLLLHLHHLGRRLGPLSHFQRPLNRRTATAQSRRGSFQHIALVGQVWGQQREDRWGSVNLCTPIAPAKRVPHSLPKPQRQHCGAQCAPAHQLTWGWWDPAAQQPAPTMAGQSLGSIHVAKGSAVVPAFFGGVGFGFFSGQGDPSPHTKLYKSLLPEPYNHRKRTQGTGISGGMPLRRIRWLNRGLFRGAEPGDRLPAWAQRHK